MVDRTIVAGRLATIRDAVARIREVLPAAEEAFLVDRTAREVVVLNLFVALQDAIDLAGHWLAAGGRHVPTSYRDLFFRLGEEGVIEGELAVRIAAATGFRNLVAHHYGVIDASLVYQIASHDLGDLEALCRAIAARVAD